MTDVLALDIATTTGWCRGRVDSDAPQCGSVCFAKSPESSHPAICGNALGWFIDLLSPPLPDILAIERMLPPAALKNRSNEHHELLGHLQGIVLGVANVRGIYQIKRYSPNSIRAHFLNGIPYGRGEVKEVTIRKCRSLEIGRAHV